jgi:hypothetical protein
VLGNPILPSADAGEFEHAMRLGPDLPELYARTLIALSVFKLRGVHPFAKVQEERVE